MKHYTLAAALTVGALGLGVAFSPQASAATTFDVIGHRGMESSAKVTENSKAAVKAALKLGAVGVEVDIRRTKDGEIVVMHDATLNRTTACSGTVEKMTYAKVRACTLDTGEKVPNLFDIASTFAAYDSKGDKFWIHVKFNPTASMRAKIFKAVDKHGLRAQTVILAEEDDTLDDFSKWSKIERALIFNADDVAQGGDESWTAGYDYAVPYRVPVTKALVAQAHASGSKVYGVESNSVSLAEAKSLGMDGLVANDVAKALAVRL